MSKEGFVKPRLGGTRGPNSGECSYELGSPLELMEASEIIRREMEKIGPDRIPVRDEARDRVRA